MMNGIIPKSEAKGTDICGMGENTFIIRSDLGCYMKTSNLDKGSDICIFSLHHACQDGDHYLGGEDGSFFIIKGDSFRRVNNLTTDSGAEVLSLHPNCQGGDHYFSTSDKFFIIFQKKGMYRITTNMNTDLEAVEYPLDPNYRNGLYYWGLSIEWFFLKPASECRVGYGNVSGENFFNYTLSHNIVNFLPGGLSITKGPSFGIWKNIKTITNDSNTPMTWTTKINKKVGYNKEKMTQITHNWYIDASASIESADLAALIMKCQFSFSAEYGGSRVNTENESWNEMTEVEEQLSFELKPNERLYLWQYKLGLGKESVFFCRDLKIDDQPNPPTEVPLPPAQS